MESKPCLLLENLAYLQRRLSIHKTDYEGFVTIDDDMWSSSLVPMRSFICVGTCILHCTILFRTFNLLRVLDILESRDLIHFPNEVWDLVHLRFLALTLNTNIPKSSSKLKNLQTLIVGYVEFFPTLISNEIWQMAELRHLEFVDNKVELINDEKQSRIKIALRDKLETLSGVRNLRFTTEMMLRIPNIRRMNLLYEWAGDFELENLVNLLQLKELKFRLFSPGNHPPELKLPHSLETLSLSGCEYPWKDLNSMVGRLPRLQVLKLRYNACKGEEWPAPNESEFQRLQVLVLSDLDLVKWNTEHNHFPALEQIIVHGCRKLVGIPLGMGDSPTLTKIELSGCLKKSVLDSAYEIEQNQHDLGNDEFRLVKSKKLTVL